MVRQEADDGPAEAEVGEGHQEHDYDRDDPDNDEQGDDRHHHGPQETDLAPRQATPNPNGKAPSPFPHSSVSNRGKKASGAGSNRPSRRLPPIETHGIYLASRPYSSKMLFVSFAIPPTTSAIPDGLSTRSARLKAAIRRSAIREWISKIGSIFS